MLSKIVSKLFSSRVHSIHFWINNPLESQRETLYTLIKNAEHTEYGDKLGFSNIRNIEDFKKQVPISHYEDLKPYIYRMMNGEKNVLWDSQIEWFAKSSGTSNDKSKFIPISKENMKQNHYEGSTDVISAYCHNYRNNKVFKGKCLIIGGSHNIHVHNEKVKYGDLSSVLLENSPITGRLFKTPELRIAIMSDWEKKIEIMTKKVSQENVTFFAGVPTWNLVLFKKILKTKNKKYLKDIWHNLEMYLHGGVNFEPYKEQFKELIGKKDFRFIEIYNASEGFIAASVLRDVSDMCLFVKHGIFYEFMELSEYYGKREKTYTLEEVQLEKNYVLIMSTNSGLWRYVIGDTITFTKLYPFCIKITGRVMHYINVYGEEVTIHNTDKALENVCKKHQCQIIDYTVAPIFFNQEEKPRHEWLIEFEKTPKDLDIFTKDLDMALQEINSDYEAKRTKDIALHPLRIIIAKKDLFHKWLKKKGKLGGQNKVPRLSNERKNIEELLQLQKTL